MDNDVKLFKEKVLKEIQEYKEFVEKDEKLDYNEKIQKLGAILFIQGIIEE